ncbi:MAG: phage terminase large subunit family protein [Myxococcota bacterium]
MVARGTSPEAGRWRSRAYQRPVLEAITDPANDQGVLYVAPSQRGGKTEILLSTIGYFMEADPSPQILISYSLEMVRRLSKRRLAGTIRETPCLRHLVKDARSRDSGNTVLEKEYPGGEWTGVGANSAGGLSMAPKRVALFDEIDRYPTSAGTEGDPIALALMRTEAYWNRVAAYVTSPGDAETSNSWQLWEQSDQRQWMVACPDCGFRTWLKWEHVHWEKDEDGRHRPETAIYACERCGVAWDDVTRWEACNAGAYEATREFSGLAGFRISALAIAGVTLEWIVRKWLLALGNPEKEKAFKTTVLAEWWTATYGKLPDETGLMARREPYAARDGRHEVPAGAALVTAGVDVQDNRFEVSYYAWGAGEESWCLGHDVILGDPSNPALWLDLDTLLLRPWPRALGGVDYVRGVAVDTGGHHTQAAYDFCGPRFRRVTPDGGRAFVFAIKGQSGMGDLWPRGPSKVTTKVPLWPIRVDVGKSQVYGRLSIPAAGPGYMHFPLSLEQPFFDGLVSEKCEQTLDRRTRKPVFTWKLKQAGARNEPLDCAVYAYAALCGLRSQGFDLEAEVEALGRRPVFTPPEASAAQQQQPAAASGPAASPRGSWLGDTSGWLRR